MNYLKLKAFSLVSTWHMKKINWIAEDDLLYQSNFNSPVRCTQGPLWSFGCSSALLYALGSSLPHELWKVPHPRISRFSAHSLEVDATKFSCLWGSLFLSFQSLLGVGNWL